MDDSERVYDVSRSDRTLSVEGRDVRKVRIWGRESGLFAEVEVDYEPWMPENRFFCSMYTPQDGYNKLYFDYCGNRVVSRGRCGSPKPVIGWESSKSRNADEEFADNQTIRSRSGRGRPGLLHGISGLCVGACGAV